MYTHKFTRSLWNSANAHSLTYSSSVFIFGGTLNWHNSKSFMRNNNSPSSVSTGNESVRDKVRVRANGIFIVARIIFKVSAIQNWWAMIVWNRLFGRKTFRVSIVCWSSHSWHVSVRHGRRLFFLSIIRDSISRSPYFNLLFVSSSSSSSPPSVSYCAKKCVREKN